MPLHHEPHAHTVPSLRRERPFHQPAVTAITFARPTACTGARRCSRVPSPSCPPPLAPHDQTVPSPRKASANPSLAQIAVTFDSALTGTGVRLRSVIVLVPVANIAVAVKEVLVGMPDWPMIAVAWVVTAAAAVGVGMLAEKALSTERLITAADVGAEEFRGGPALFPRHVLRAFALLWAIMFAVASNMGADADIRLQLLVNLGVLFLGGSFFLIRRYRLNVREALALRAPRPAVWLAVLIGAPAGLLTATGVFRLANLVFPVPQKMLEAFGQGLLPDSIPFWQLILLLTVAPGICEEIAFRGVLLHGLRRRFSPVVLALVTGAIFGFFHTSLFRIVPTAFLGVLLAAVTLLSGSIFPAMLWHAANNALGVLGGHYEVPLYDLDAWLYLAAAAVLALAFWIIWRNRTPYPDLRPGRR